MIRFETVTDGVRVYRGRRHIGWITSKWKTNCFGWHSSQLPGQTDKLNLEELQAIVRVLKQQKRARRH